MNHCNVVVAAVAFAALAGCATPNSPSQQAPQSQEDKGYVTGSRLPVRNGATTANVKGISGQDAAEEMRRNNSGHGSPIPGN